MTSQAAINKTNATRSAQTTATRSPRDRDEEPRFTARRSAQFDRGEERPERPRGGAPRRPQRGAESSATRSAELERDEERPERPRGGASRATATRSVESERGEQRRERARRGAPGPRGAPSRARRGAPTRPRGGAPSSTATRSPDRSQRGGPRATGCEAARPSILRLPRQVCRLERSGGAKSAASRVLVPARRPGASCPGLAARHSAFQVRLAFKVHIRRREMGNEEPGERRSGSPRRTVNGEPEPELPPVLPDVKQRPSILRLPRQVCRLERSGGAKPAASRSRPREGAPDRSQRGAPSGPRRGAPSGPRRGAPRATATRSAQSDRDEERRERARRGAPGRPPRGAPSSSATRSAQIDRNEERRDRPRRGVRARHETVRGRVDAGWAVNGTGWMTRGSADCVNGT